MTDPCPRCPCPGECLRWPVFCGWAAEDPPDEAKIRHIRNRSSGDISPHVEPPPPPTAAQMAASLGHALFDWAVSGFSMASDEERARRLSICAGCEHWDGARCKLCGCYTEYKVRMKTEHCPINKW